MKKLLLSLLLLLQITICSAQSLTPTATKEYVKKYGWVARQLSIEYEIPASIIMSEAIVRSGVGTVNYAVQLNNHTAIKCFSRKCKKGHCQKIGKDHYIRYKSIFASYEALCKMISFKQGFENLKKYEDDYRQWSYGLCVIGWTVISAERRIGLIEGNRLMDLDYQK